MPKLPVPYLTADNLRTDQTSSNVFYPHQADKLSDATQIVLVHGPFVRDKPGQLMLFWPVLHWRNFILIDIPHCLLQEICHIRHEAKAEVMAAQRRCEELKAALLRCMKASHLTFPRPACAFLHLLQSVL